MERKGKPIYLLSDGRIREIREWRGRVNNLKLYRAKGYCEICKYPLGVFNPHLKGHHIIQPTLVKDENKNNDNNIIICCDSCYGKYIIGNDKNVNEWFLTPTPNIIVGLHKIKPFKSISFIGRYRRIMHKELR